MTTYIDVIRHLKAGAQVALVGGDTYEHIDWGNEEPLPKEQLDAAFPAAQEAKALKAKLSQVVSMRQARLALLGAGYLHLVDNAVANMAGTEGEAARIEWEYATEVRRDSPLAAGLSAALGLTEAQLDSLFTQAATL